MSSTDTLLPNLENLKLYGSEAQVEEFVKLGIDRLHQLRHIFDVLAPNAINQKWLKSVDELIQRPVRVRTVLGVVGSTGAGKSSMINAALGEEMILATSSVRACTAVPTEISFNRSEDPEETYRAEVEFISDKEWRAELDLLFHDLLTEEGGIAPDSRNADRPAGIAYAKVRAVYPQLARTHEMIKNCNPAELAEVPEVLEVLGTVKVIHNADPDMFSEEVQRYLDSQEAATKSGSRTKKRMAYWPIIKRVRIFTKSRVLSTGVCLVDLVSDLA
jgi:hypothetical protein